MPENETAGAAGWRQWLNWDCCQKFLKTNLSPPFNRCPELTALLMLFFGVVLSYFFQGIGFLIFSLILAILTFYSLFFRQGEVAAQEWLKGLKYASAQEADPEKVRWTLGNYQEITGKTLERAQEPFIRRLFEQKKEIEARARHHLVVLEYFYPHYYACITLATYASVIAAVLLAVISKYGWDNLNNYISIFFLTASSSALLFGGFIKLYSMDKNIADNKKLYLQYIAIDNGLETYLFTDAHGFDDKKLDLKSYVILIDKKLEMLNNIAVGFDTSNIPDINKMSKELLPKTTPA